jgi:hypothetical protein
MLSRRGDSESWPSVDFSGGEMMRQRTARLAAAVAVGLGVAGAAAIPAAARAATLDGSGSAAVPRILLPMSASWTSAQRGIVLGYPSRTAGARPSLLETGNGGRTWATLTPPPVTYPADNDQPGAVLSRDVIAVTDGTHIEVSADNGKRWAADKLCGVSGSFSVARLTVSYGRVFALVTRPTSAAVYAAAPSSRMLCPVAGLSISGPDSYGDITSVGALQVDLGRGQAAEKYWYSSNGTRFTAARLPCPAAEQAFLGGVRSGKVVALCSAGPSAIGLGETAARLQVASRLGAAFAGSGPTFDLSNIEDFGAASATSATIATEGDLIVTANGGKSWRPELTQGNGAFWTGLAFPTSAIGYVVCSTVNNASRFVFTVYRTTNGGKSWGRVPLP